MIRFLQKLFTFTQLPVSFYGRTDTGKVREHNEDSFCTLRNRKLFVVADGMGGHNAGEVASSLAIESLIDYFSKERIKKIRGNSNAIRHNLITGFHHVNKVVMDQAASSNKLNGMGCTFVACLLDKNKMHSCHVGDARCYLLANGKLKQITTDHTGVTYFAKDKTTGEETQKPRNVVTRAIGFPFNQDPEYHETQLAPANKILLCSDGLWSMVSDLEIEDILNNTQSPEQASEQLVAAANEQGGRDNITALVVFVEE
jgi:protein phosphatase